MRCHPLADRIDFQFRQSLVGVPNSGFQPACDISDRLSTASAVAAPRDEDRTVRSRVRSLGLVLRELLDKPGGEVNGSSCPSVRLRLSDRENASSKVFCWDLAELGVELRD